MKPLIKRKFIGVVTVLAVIFFVYTLYGAVGGSVIQVDAGPSVLTIATTTSEPRGFGKPVRLLIPTISINAKVQEVGLTAKNAMGIPTNFTDVGWYKYGTIPGEVGSAVIDGHVDNGLGLKGVFKNLHKVQIGDEITVIDISGTEIRFNVIDIKEYKYDEAPSEEIFNESQKSILRLITCGGKWIKSAKTYDTRVVVTAEFKEL